MGKINYNDIADKIANEVKAKGSNKVLKVKTLLGLFNYEKRTEEITTTITELLTDRDIIINPSIMKVGVDWKLAWDDRVFLSVREETILQENKSSSILPEYWNNDEWFDKVKTKKFRNEKEVETKFIIPLLLKLGYLEDDRFDGMPVDAIHGSKETRIVCDFALYNIENPNINDQVLLVVEAKKEDHLIKMTDLTKSQKQLKCYGLWLGCACCVWLCVRVFMCVCVRACVRV